MELYAPLCPKALGSSPVTDHFSDLIFNIFSLYVMLCYGIISGRVHKIVGYPKCVSL